MSIEIVTHCWSGPQVPIYHKLLHLQLSSIYFAPPKIDLRISVCFCPKDELTSQVVEQWYLLFSDRPNIDFCPNMMSEGQLFRRAIGRNARALLTEVDVIWFTDCDYLFLKGSLERAHQYCLPDAEMVFPDRVNIHEKHEYGDDLIDSFHNLNPRPLYPDDLTKFTSRRESRGYGGLQIVKGDYAREHGYLNGTKWILPVDPAEGFRSCKCDVPFRKSVTSQRVAIPNVYRVRHSRAGRDNGTVDHGEKTR